MQRVLALCGLCASLAALSAEGGGNDAVFAVSDDRADCLNACGEKAMFAISTPQTSCTLGEPGFMRLRVRASGGGKQKIYGVGFEPEKIRKTSPSPEDFDAFWSEAKRKLDETTPVDAQLEAWLYAQERRQ